MPNTNEALKVWEALRPMVDREIEARTRSCVRATKMVLNQPPIIPDADPPPDPGETDTESSDSSEQQATEPTEGCEETSPQEEPTLEPEEPQDKQIFLDVSEPYGNSVVLPTGTQFSNLEQGDPVWVYWYYNNASTMHVMLNGNGTPGKADIQALKAEVAASGSGIYTYINNVSSELRTEISYGDSNLWSYISISASALRSEFHDAVSDLHSSIEQTASHIRADVWAASSTLYSYVEMTASNIRSEVGNTVSDMYSSIEQTASSIRADVWAASSTLYSYVELTASSLKTEIGNTESSLYSSITQTAEGIRADVSAANSAIYAYVQVTASNIKTEIVDSMSDIYQSVIEQTASYIRTEVAGSLSEIRSYTEQTRSMIISAVGSISTIAGNVDAIQGSAIWQSESQIANVVGALKYQDDYFEDENGGYARYWSTSEQKWIYYEVGPSYTGTRYRLEHNLHVQEGVGMRIDKREGQESVSYGFYDQDNLTAGAIVQMINGQSQYIIMADKINLQGYVTTQDLTANYLASIIADISQLQTGAIYGSSLNIGNSQAGISSSGTSWFTTVDTLLLSFDGSNYFNDCVTSLSTSGNTLSWTTASGGTGSFSKAVSLSGEWNGTAVAGKYYEVVATMGSTSAGVAYSGNVTATIVPVYNSATHAYDISYAAVSVGDILYSNSDSTDTEAYDEGADSVTVDLNNTYVINEAWQGHTYVATVLIKLTNGKQTEAVFSLYP